MVCTFYCDECTGEGEDECTTCSTADGIIDNVSSCSCDDDDYLFYEMDPRTCSSKFMQKIWFPGCGSLLSNCVKCTSDTVCTECSPDSILEDHECKHMYDYDFSLTSADRLKNGNVGTGEEIFQGTIWRLQNS